MKLRRDHPIEVAAAKADISRSTRYRIAQAPRFPSQTAQPRNDRLRALNLPHSLEWATQKFQVVEIKMNRPVATHFAATIAAGTALRCASQPVV